MTQQSIRLLPAPALRPHVLFAALGAASIALSWRALRDLTALSLSADAYSYILLIPVIVAFVLYLEWREVISCPGTSRSPVIAALPFAAALAIFGLLAMHIVNPPAEYVLSIEVASVVATWAAAFALCYGVPALRAARFPFLLLVLLVPVPSHWMQGVVTVLQSGSAEAAYLLFRLAGVPIFRTGVTFQLPIVSIEVARECSSIHSACALFITGLLVGHLFLRSLWAKVLLSLLTVPIAMFTNSVRIVTLWFLATKVDIGFLYGNLHHHGGVLFALIALAILMGFVHLLRKTGGGERAPQRVMPPGFSGQ